LVKSRFIQITLLSIMKTGENKSARALPWHYNKI
jgi:hypothetical protein